MKSIVTVENGSASWSAGIGAKGGVVGLVFVFHCGHSAPRGLGLCITKLKIHMHYYKW